MSSGCNLPAPVLQEHEDIVVVRDDLLPGGTKRRVVHHYFDEEHDEYVYASPVYGYAQVALAYAARDYGKRATIVCAQRKHRHPLTLEAVSAGATVVEVPWGYLSVVQARARNYCERSGARLLPFGFDEPGIVAALADVARAVPYDPKEVWSVAGSGVLTRALQLAWPDAAFFAVRIGAEPSVGRATLYFAPEAYEKPASWRPPFPSCANYDAKAWAFVQQHAKPGALFWNVAK